PDEVLQDPVWERSGRTERGRDGSRVPMPWSGDTPPFGFSGTADTWLPIPAEWAPLTADKQLRDDESTLSFFRTMIELRHSRSEFDGVTLDWLDSPRDAVVFRSSGGLICALNTGRRPIAIPEGELLLASGPLAGR